MKRKKILWVLLAIYLLAGLFCMPVFAAGSVADAV